MKQTGKTTLEERLATQAFDPKMRLPSEVLFETLKRFTVTLIQDEYLPSDLPVTRGPVMAWVIDAANFFQVNAMDAAAKIAGAGLSPQMVWEARQVKKADPEEFEKIARGETTIDAAFKKVVQPQLKWRFRSRLLPAYLKKLTGSWNQYVEGGKRGVWNPPRLRYTKLLRVGKKTEERTKRMDRLVMGYLERNNPTSAADANRMILEYLKRYYAEDSHPS